MKRILLPLLLMLALLTLCGCSKSLREKYGDGHVYITPAPMHTSAPVEKPERIVPTLAPEPEMNAPAAILYQSTDYPLTAKSLRPRDGSRYPEEARLNEDPDMFYTVVDITNQAVFVYERDYKGDYTVLVREMICSSGIEPGHRSPRGVFPMDSDYKRFGFFVNFNLYGQYWSQIRGSIYFHSVPYSERDDRTLIEEEFWKLGSPASHGCIRLTPDDAHWVYLYLCPGSLVEITDELEPDEELRARLMPTALPTPDCYMTDD